MPDAVREAGKEDAMLDAICAGHGQRFGTAAGSFRYGWGSSFSVRPAAYAFTTTKRLLHTEKRGDFAIDAIERPLHCTLCRHETFQP